MPDDTLHLAYIVFRYRIRIFCHRLSDSFPGEDDTGSFLNTAACPAYQIRLSYKYLFLQKPLWQTAAFPFLQSNSYGHTHRQVSFAGTYHPNGRKMSAWSANQEVFLLPAGYPHWVRDPLPMVCNSPQIPVCFAFQPLRTNVRKG